MTCPHYDFLTKLRSVTFIFQFCTFTGLYKSVMCLLSTVIHGWTSNISVTHWHYLLMTFTDCTTISLFLILSLCANLSFYFLFMIYCLTVYLYFKLQHCFIAISFSCWATQFTLYTFVFSCSVKHCMLNTKHYLDTDGWHALKNGTI